LKLKIREKNIILELADTPYITLTKLAKKTEYDKGNTRNCLTRLEKKDLVKGVKLSRGYEWGLTYQGIFEATKLGVNIIEVAERYAPFMHEFKALINLDKHLMKFFKYHWKKGRVRLLGDCFKVVIVNMRFGETVTKWAVYGVFIPFYEKYPPTIEEAKRFNEAIEEDPSIRTLLAGVKMYRIIGTGASP